VSDQPIRRIMPPDVTPALIAYLNQEFPDRLPPLDATDRTIWASVGARQVVKHLHEIMRRQNADKVRTQLHV
jgi:hypothetical protein